MSNALVVIVMALFISAPLLLAGCRPEGAMQVRGQVVEVVARSFSELELLRIRDAQGKEYAFETDGFVGFTPSHVREHQIFGQSLLVTYEKRGVILVAVKLED